MNKKLNILVLVIGLAIFIVLLFYANSGRDTQTSGGGSFTSYEKARVTSILSEDYKASDAFEGQNVGSQIVMIKITSGEYKGLSMSAINYLGAMYGTPLKEGDRIVTSLYVENDEVKSATVYEIDRMPIILLLLLAFVIITVLIGGKKGALSLMGLLITVVSLIWILIPLLMKGAPTLLATLLICIYVSIISFTLLDGISKKTLCADIGTIGGMALALIFGWIAQSLLKVNGMRMGDYVDALIQLKQSGTPLKISGLLSGGIVIASLGAVMDVAMSISSALRELTTVNPNLSKKDIWKSGMNIGRDMIGTMTNTLILAFVGSSFLLVIYIWSLGVPFYELGSSTLVATEMVHGLASSIGVILAVPLTILTCSFFYSHKK